MSEVKEKDVSSTELRSHWVNGHIQLQLKKNTSQYVIYFTYIYYRLHATLI